MIFSRLFSNNTKIECHKSSGNAFVFKLNFIVWNKSLEISNLSVSLCLYGHFYCCCNLLPYFLLFTKIRLTGKINEIAKFVSSWREQVSAFFNLAFLSYLIFCMNSQYKLRVSLLDSILLFLTGLFYFVVYFLHWFSACQCIFLLLFCAGKVFCPFFSVVFNVHSPSFFALFGHFFFLFNS